MPPMYLWSSHQYHLGYLSDKWEHAPPVTRAIAELYRQLACEVQLQSTSQACRRWRLVWPSSWPLQCSYQNSIPGSTGGHVAFASAAYENQAFWPRARQGKISSFTMFISEHQCKTNVRRFCSLITQIIFFCNYLSLLNCTCFHFLNLESLKRIMLPFLPLETSDTAYNDTQGRTDMKTRENCWKELYNLCECIFHQLATKKCECQCSNNDLLPG